MNFEPEETRRLALEHAWSWFQVHANQRMQLLNFFFLGAAFLTTAYAAASVNDAYLVAAGIASSGAVISVYFWRLDRRTRQLVQGGEAVLRHFETELAAATGIKELEILKEVDTSEPFTTYGVVIRLLYFTAITAFALGVAGALGASSFWE